MTTVDSDWYNIYLGLKEGYDGPKHTFEDALDVIQRKCDEVGLCVTVTPTTFIYSGGREQGVIVGLINYPRFPSTKEELRDKTLGVARHLARKFNQYRVSVVGMNETHMVADYVDV